MHGKPFNHLSQRHPVPFVVGPVVVERTFVDRPYHLRHMQVVVFPQSEQVFPVFVPIVLKAYPKVVVLCVVGKYEHAHFRAGHGVSAARGILQTYHPLVVVACRVDEMPDEHLYVALLAVKACGDGFFRQGTEEFFLHLYGVEDVRDDVCEVIHCCRVFGCDVMAFPLCIAVEGGAKLRHA